ncbi:multidrug efflux SMR transporter [Verrucomicrobiaceae bacterium 227]
MAWIYLIIAGIFEIGWPVGLKLSQQPQLRLTGIGIAILFMALSGYFLWMAQRSIPIGTAYAIWTGIGAAGTFMVGIIFFNDSSSLSGYLGVMLIIGGVVTLKLSH